MDLWKIDRQGNEQSLDVLLDTLLSMEADSGKRAPLPQGEEMFGGEKIFFCLLDPLSDLMNNVRAFAHTTPSPHAERDE